VRFHWIGLATAQKAQGICEVTELGWVGFVCRKRGRIFARISRVVRVSFGPCSVWGTVERQGRVLVWNEGDGAILGLGPATGEGWVSGQQRPALGINNAGQVTGTSRLALNPGPGDGANHAFLYSAGVMQDLGALGPAAFSSIGWGINNSGNVTGEAGLGNGATHAFFWNGTSMQDLGTLNGGYESKGYAINDANQITGSFYIGQGGSPIHAFLWDGTTMHDLGVPTGFGTSTGRAKHAAGSAVVHPDSARPTGSSAVDKSR
jgi:probable HAF family extracellular repeat protein